MKSRLPTAQPKKSRFRFVGEIIGELRKAVWPTRQEAIRLSLLVLALCAIAGLILGAIDYGFTELVTNVFLRPK